MVYVDIAAVSVAACSFAVLFLQYRRAKNESTSNQCVNKHTKIDSEIQALREDMNGIKLNYLDRFAGVMERMNEHHVSFLHELTIVKEDILKAMK